MDELESWKVESLRRSIAMLAPDQPVTGLQREEALRILAELQRLEQRDRKVTQLVAQLQAVLGEGG
jgi:hypothetical protein